MRAERLALVAGCALAIAAGVLTAASTMVHPVAGDAPLVLSRQSGALFVRVGDRLRPVANLASADLILGEPATPRLVDDTGLGGVSRGPTLGIPGAPGSVGTLISPADQRWAVCDNPGGTTTVTVAGSDEPPELPSRSAVLVSAPHGDGSVYLLYAGRRAVVDPDNPITTRALRLNGVKPRPVSSTLLNAIPEVPVIGPPRITGAGEPSGVAAFPVGSVLRIARAGSDEYYVVLRDGLQRVGRLTADLIRFADPAADAEIRTVSPDLTAGGALADTLPVGTYPDDAPTLLDVSGELCATWRSGKVGITVGAGGAGRGSDVTLATSDGAGPNVDVIGVPPGRGVDVTAAMLTSSTGTSGRYLVTDAGIRFPVRDSAAAAALGLGEAPAPVPWAIIGTLPAGPELSREAALIARDVAGGATP